MGGDAKVKVVVTMITTLGVVESEIVSLTCRHGTEQVIF
ncbi:hypothetical protein HMPREF9961_0087 [Streptococcus australis ATCC 700641]|nr:hypothetical protein HMPREF9961_0087 [Streptococcus australis ATCC 700641]